MNLGIIAGLFTSTVVFTSIIFRFLYHEKIKWSVLFGMGLIVSGVFFVSVKDFNTKNDNLYLSIFFALFIGFLFTTSSLISREFVKRGNITPIQFNIDGFMI